MPEENQNVEEIHTVKEVHTVEEIHSTNESAQPHKEIQTQKEEKNTVALVGMICSIIWLICLFTIIGSAFWLFLFYVGFVLWIIGLFYKPRGKARVAITIPLIVFVAIASLACYIWSSIKTPAMQFADWIKVEFENIDEETFDNERFNNIANEEFDNIFSSINEQEFKSLLEASTWSNILEKWSYVIFWLLQQGFENSFEKYNSGYLPEIDNNENIKIDINEDDTDIDITAENNSNENNIDENLNNNEDNDSNTDKESLEEESAHEEVKQENVEIFSETEKNDIEQIINILE